MDMTREAMEFIQELTEKAAPVHHPMEICGKTYVNERLIRMDAKPKAEPLHVSTLTGFMDYVLRCNLEYSGRPMMIHVASPTHVEFISTLDEEREREVLCVADAKVNEFRFNTWMDQEPFILSLQANFNPSDDRDLILKFAGNAIKQNEVAYADDGITQTATMKMGAASAAKVQVPNPVLLAPFRTFQEIKQPETHYIFRMRGQDSLQFLLTDASNGIWQNEAVIFIKEYIKAALAMKNDTNDIVVIG